MTDGRPTLRFELDLVVTVLTDRNKALPTIQTYEDAVQNLATYGENTGRSTALADIDFMTIRAYRTNRAETLRPTSMAVDHVPSMLPGSGRRPNRSFATPARTKAPSSAG